MNEDYPEDSPEESPPLLPEEPPIPKKIPRNQRVVSSALVQEVLVPACFPRIRLPCRMGVFGPSESVCIKKLCIFFIGILLMCVILF
jgi:hypothetical protein